MNTVAGGEVGERGKFVIQSGLSLGYHSKRGSEVYDESVFFCKNCWQDTQIRSLLPPSFPYYILAEAFIGIQTIIPTLVLYLWVLTH